jgi:hypothetical protein
VRELVNILGELREPNDYYHGAPGVPVRNDWEFTLPPGWGRCFLSVYTDTVGGDVPKRRVIAFHFGVPAW